MLTLKHQVFFFFFLTERVKKFGINNLKTERELTITRSGVFFLFNFD